MRCRGTSFISLAIRSSTTDRRRRIGDVETLKKKERILTSAGLDEITTRWLSGPIRRYAEDVTQVDPYVRLDRYCPIPGSYAIEVVARCQIGKTLRKEFALLHMRRYQTDELSAALRSIGWATVARLVIEGNPKEATDALMLFQRMRK